MVDSGVELDTFLTQLRSEIAEKCVTHTDLVHDGDASIFRLLLKLEHSWGDIASSNNILLVSNRRLYDGGMVCIGDQANDEIVLGHSGVQSLVIRNVYRDRARKLDTFRQFPSAIKRPAGWKILIEGVPGETSRTNDSPTVTSIPASVRTSNVGLVTKPEPL